LIARTKAEVAGTTLCARLALECGLSCSTAGGTHHAHRSFGSGFCIVNDLAVTTEVLLSEGKVKRVLILDLDVHQGDGTASIFEGRPDVFTLSVHAEKNFPARKQASTLDIGLQDGVEDDEYVGRVAEALGSVLPSFRPDLVLYDAGVDVHKDDELGKLSLSDEGIFRRDSLVLDSCMASGIPIACFVGGGYHSCLNTLADRHILLHRAASQLWLDHEL
jgi:acetoin utilization deacetylase AcuC-like enzyme